MLDLAQLRAVAKASEKVNPLPPRRRAEPRIAASTGEPDRRIRTYKNLPPRAPVDLNELRVRCRQLRLQYGLSLHELAEKAGISRSAVRYFETGERNVRFDLVIYIFAVFGKRIAEVDP